MKLYELVGRDKTQGYSPFVWRSRLALEHKGLDYELVSLRFTEIKETLSFANSKTVPVLEDNGKAVSDSWEIACYLEDTYPDRPPLFTDRSSAKLFDLQVAMPLLAPLFRTIVSDIYDILDEENQQYFRQTREPRIGCTIEEARDNFEQPFKIFKDNLWPYSQYFKSAGFIGGATPVYQDYVLYGMFLWARMTSPKRLLDDGDPLLSWIERMDRLFGGLGGRMKYIG